MKSLRRADGTRLRSPWFVVFKPNPHARVRLFCFSYAGGGPAVFRDWPAALSSDVELLAVQLPGHGGRYSEPLVHSVESLVQSLQAEILNYTDIPYGFFGHSMGATLAYELTALLQQQGAVLPSHLMVSARRAPHLPRAGEIFSKLPDAEFIEKLGTFGATADDIMSNPELVRLLLPVWRADFALAEEYEHRERPPVSCPLTAFGGRSDTWISEEETLAWRRFTTGPFAARMFDGGHFFLHACAAELLPEIDARLAKTDYGTRWSS